MISPEQIEFDAESHGYWLYGEKTPSVTTILECEGLTGCPFWDESDRRRGSAVHHIALLIGASPIIGSTAEEIVFNSPWDPSTTDPRLVGYGMAVAGYYADTGMQPVFVEKPVASLRFRVCGTLDVYARMPNGQFRLTDFKSGQPQEAAHVQTAIYDMCLEETTGHKTDERVACWLKPTATYQVVRPKLAPHVYMNAGQSAINLYRWRETFKKLG